MRRPRAPSAFQRVILGLALGLFVGESAGALSLVGDAYIRLLQMTVGLSDGKTLYAVRYSSMNDSRSLFYTSDASKVRDLYPEHPKVDLVGDSARPIISEPTSDLEGGWNPVPESTAVIVKAGGIELRPFECPAS